MDRSAFAVFKYSHPDPGEMSRAQKIAAAGLAVAGVIGLFAFPPAGFFLLIVAIIVVSQRTRQILLGPRYLLCGNTLIYYANVRRLVRTDDRLTVETEAGRTLVLEREQFPTNARKTDKIARNKAVKFAKVSDKIAEKVRKAAPQAQTIGFAA